MATRFYLPANDRPSQVNPAYSPEWDLTTSAQRCAMRTTKTVSAGSTIAATKGGANRLNQDVLMAQHVSLPLAAQTISGTVQGVLRLSQSNALLNARTQLIVKVVSNDGATVRGVLWAGDLSTLEGDPASELPTSATSRLLNRGGPATLTPVNAEDGDRLVVETGYRVHSSTTVNYTVSGIYTDAYAGDRPLDETTTSVSLSPWVEFSQDLVFKNMATRLYLPSAGTSPVPYTPRSEWHGGTDDLRQLPMLTEKSGTPMVSVTRTETATTAQNMFVAQYVSPPMAAQSLSGHIRGFIRGSENNTSANASPVLNAYVISEDGSTLRRNLLGVRTSGTVSGEFTTSLSSRLIAGDADNTASRFIAPNNLQSGDRLVVEIGVRFHNTSATSYSATMVIGDDAATDFTAIADTTVRNPWIEFTEGVKLLDTGGSVDAEATLTKDTLSVSGNPFMATATASVDAEATLASSLVSLVRKGFTGASGTGAAATLNGGTFPASGRPLSASVTASATLGRDQLSISGRSFTGSAVRNEVATLGRQTLGVTERAFTGTAVRAEAGLLTRRTLTLSGKSFSGTAIRNESATLTRDTVTPVGRPITASTSGSAILSRDLVSLSGRPLQGRSSGAATVSRDTLSVSGRSFLGFSGESYAAHMSPKALSVLGRPLTGHAAISAFAAISKASLGLSGRPVTGAAAGAAQLARLVLTINERSFSGGAEVNATLGRDTLVLTGRSLTATVVTGAFGTLLPATLEIEGKPLVGTFEQRVDAGAVLSTLVLTPVGKSLQASAGASTVLIPVTLLVSGKPLQAYLRLPMEAVASFEAQQPSSARQAGRYGLISSARDWDRHIKAHAPVPAFDAKKE